MPIDNGTLLLFAGYPPEIAACQSDMTEKVKGRGRGPMSCALGSEERCLNVRAAERMRNKKVSLELYWIGATETPRKRGFQPSR
jgi:hypothetical protein